MEIATGISSKKTKPNKANCRVGGRMDFRLRGNDRYGIPSRWKILYI